MRLRFKDDAELHADHQHRRGWPVIVLSDLKLVGPSGVDGGYSWRQEILAMGNGCLSGWAKPEQLELPRDAEGRELDYRRLRYAARTPRTPR
jgi:hypothetical protein